MEHRERDRRERAIEHRARDRGERELRDEYYKGEGRAPKRRAFLCFVPMRFYASFL